MLKNNYIIGFFLSLATIGYITLVSYILQSAEELFGGVSHFWGPVMFLSLFVFSALITSTLILGYPIWLYLDGQKSSALKIFFTILGWLFILLVAIFLTGIFWL